MVTVISQGKETNSLKEVVSNTNKAIKQKMPKIIGKKEGNEEVLDLLQTIIADQNGEDFYVKPISDEILKLIKDDLSKTFPNEVLNAPKDEKVRKKLVERVLSNHKNFVKGNQETAEYVVREMVGTGVIEKLLENDSITDIGWNGKLLSIKTNDNELLVKGTNLGITNKYIEGLIAKYAVRNDRNFNSGSPIFDGMWKDIRINAVHEDNSPNGATISLRRARPQLALNKNNFENFAPKFLLDLFRSMVITKSNIVISGETGTGKTELQKLLLSFITTGNKVIMVEDVQETHAQTLFPDLEVYSWLTSPKINISDLVVAALRNTPNYLIVSETRDSAAYQMFTGILAGQCIITTLHAVNARAIPRRFVGMAAGGYPINEQSFEEDVNRYFHFGVHIKKITIDGKVHRYLNEILEFNEHGGETIFEQKFINGEFVITKVGNLSESFNERLGELFESYEMPDNIEIYSPEQPENESEEDLSELPEVVGGA